ncbi:putative alpha/beta hydrolase family esterase [Actinoplanes tereljensis]|uniref:alpha/beta hydrolase n=1 Tax=Paractinoplanes tereljensis TaxID=571912 RepID=UPI001940DFD6|nr:alpha/beta fold hydrolase [Actinoplanes tereljensis]
MESTFGAVFLHGAGPWGGERFMALAEAFARLGGHAVGLDFLGHGKSDGRIVESSLRSRQEQAEMIIEKYCPPPIPLLLFAFSMGGHTAIRIAGSLGSRVKGLGLLAPACYAREAEDLSFGLEFSTVLRRNESWHDSPAFAAAATFSGQVAMIVGSMDQTVPWGVTEELLRAFRNQSQSLRLDVLGDVGHNVLAAVNERPDLVTQIMTFLGGARGLGS